MAMALLAPCGAIRMVFVLGAVLRPPITVAALCAWKMTATRPTLAHRHS